MNSPVEPAACFSKGETEQESVETCELRVEQKQRTALQEWPKGLKLPKAKSASDFSLTPHFAATSKTLYPAHRLLGSFYTSAAQQKIGSHAP
jgi:hypothetical protein